MIGKRYAFLFEDVWFILIQYLYFEKFVVNNAIYLSNKAGEFKATSSYEVRHATWYEPNRAKFEYTWENFGFMLFNLIFTALCGLGGLVTIPFCFKMIKQRKTKAKIFYTLTLIQTLLQTTFPFMRAVLVILQVSDVVNSVVVYYAIKPIYHCILVGFQVYTFRI